MGENRKPNIILIYTDQQRYDTLGINHNPYIKTPNLDKLGREGVIFSRAYTTTPLCVPSRVAMFTGRCNHANLSYNNSKFIYGREKDFVTLLRCEGYTAGLSGKDHCFGPCLKDRFDWIRKISHAGFMPPQDELELEINNYRKDKFFTPFCDDPFPAQENITSRIFKSAIDFIKRNKDNPFFLWISVPDPHPPYMVSEPYASMYDRVDVPLPEWREDEFENKPYRQKVMIDWGILEKQYPSEEDIKKLKRIYWGMVSCIDDQIGKLTDFLEEIGERENTIIVFTSDHGDYLGDHGMIRKGPHLYEALTHVPLIFSWPGNLKERETDAMVCNLDIFPTIFDLMGLYAVDGIHGKSFAAVLKGESDTHREMIFMEHGEPGEPILKGSIAPEEETLIKNRNDVHLCQEICRGRSKAVRTKQWKYVYNYGDVDELYNLESDPHELVNLADKTEYEAVVREHRDYLIKWLIETEDMQY